MSTIVYNMDCMEGMKEYPDKYFDLAIVDPPYGSGLGEGGGCGGWFAPYRENAGGGISRANFHGKKKYNLGSQVGKRREMELSERGGEVGQRNSEKNHFVGCAA